MQLNVRLFATLKDRARTDTLAVDLPETTATVRDLLSHLARKSSALAPSLKTVIVAVNHEFALSDQPLHPGDEIALFPPVSGG